MGERKTFYSKIQVIHTFSKISFTIFFYNIWDNMSYWSRKSNSYHQYILLFSRKIRNHRTVSFSEVQNLPVCAYTHRGKFSKKLLALRNFFNSKNLGEMFFFCLFYNSVHLSIDIYMYYITFYSTSLCSSNIDTMRTFRVAYVAVKIILYFRFFF